MNGKLAALVARIRARRIPAAKPCSRYVTAEEARRRWAALAAFHKANGHFLVTNGPYKLKAWSADSVTLEAFRDLTYPLGVGSYDAYAIPARLRHQGDWDGRASRSPATSRSSRNSSAAIAWCARR